MRQTPSRRAVTAAAALDSARCGIGEEEKKKKRKKEKRVDVSSAKKKKNFLENFFPQEIVFLFSAERMVVGMW